MKYTIKQASEKLSIKAHTLRYYETQGVILPIDRDKNGNREYSEQDIVWLDIVKCLKETDMSLVDIKRIVELSDVENSNETLEERKAILLRHKGILEEKILLMKKSILKIDKKIAYYNGQEIDC